MSHKLKVNVHHNGKAYTKGAIIKKGDEGFEQLVQAGHAEPLEIPKEVEGDPEKSPVEHSKSQGKSAK